MVKKEALLLFSKKHSTNLDASTTLIVKKKIVFLDVLIQED